MQRDDLIMFCTTDFAGQVKGKGFPAKDFEARRSGGIGWTPTNIMITPFGPIADSPWGPFGDVMLMPDLRTRVVVDFDDGSPMEHFFLCDVLDAEGTPWDCCPRGFLKQALADLQEQAGLHLAASFEQEFYYDGAPEDTVAGYSLDAFRRQGAFGETFVRALSNAGVDPETFLPEYGPRQYEVTCRPAEGVLAADRAVIVREMARATAYRLGHRVSFSPVVTPDAVGNGVHVHMSLRDREDKPVAYDAKKPHGLSETAGRFAAGILRHMPALCALTAPSVVSSLRLVPHRWSAAWSNLGLQDREAGVRICPLFKTPGADLAAQFNLEYRAADAAANPYLGLGAIVRAGLEGVRAELPVPEPTEADPESLGAEERKRRGIVRLPQSLDEALKALEKDSVARSWFPQQLYDAYMGYKRFEIGLMKDLDRDERCARYAKVY